MGKAGFPGSLRALKPGGRYLLIGFPDGVLAIVSTLVRGICRAVRMVFDHTPEHPSPSLATDRHSLDSWRFEVECCSSQFLNVTSACTRSNKSYGDKNDKSEREITAQAGDVLKPFTI